MIETDIELISDRKVANILGMSKSWVRQERYKCKQGLPYSFDLKPVYVGKCPRYKRSEVLKWIETAELRGSL